MELNLRKARKLEGKIGLAIKAKKNELSSSFSLRVNEDEAAIEGLVAIARANFFLELKEIEDLISVKQEIRDQIAKANFVVGINDTIAQKVLIEEKISFLNEYAKVEVFDILGAKDSVALSKKQQESERGSMYARTNVGIHVLTKIDKDKINADRSKLQREIEALEDKLAELNFSTKILVASSSIKLLQGNSLI
jgi:valyl-tRNA synthetase